MTSVGQEPISGVSGDVSKGEPYDAGNLGEPGTTNEPILSEPVTSPSTNTGVSGTTTTPHTGTTTGQQREVGSTGTADASKFKDSSAATGDHSKAHTDTRSPEDPATNPGDKHTQAKQNVDDSTGGTDENTNPVKIDGPGPKPISDVAHEFGGDAGNAPSSDSLDKKGKEGGDAAGKGKDEEDDDDGPQKVSHGEGTGEKYVKSSGLKADGGDFDAANPGAGREADRLLEEKGIHHEQPGKTSTTDADETAGSKAHDSKESGDGKTKLSLKDKIQAKLHKN